LPLKQNIKYKAHNKFVRMTNNNSRGRTIVSPTKIDRQESSLLIDDNLY